MVYFRLNNNTGSGALALRADPVAVVKVPSGGIEVGVRWFKSAFGQDVFGKRLKVTWSNNIIVKFEKRKGTEKRPATAASDVLGII